MTDTNQDFITYNGDAQNPVFTVYSDAANTVPRNLVGVNNIKVTFQRDLQNPIVLTKQMTSLPPGISFVTDGTNGQFKINFTAADTQGLSGFYLMFVMVIDGGNNQSTVAVGRWQAAPSPIATYSGDPANSTRDLIRALVNDMDPDNALYPNEIYDQLTVQFGGPLNVAAQVCRMLAQRYAGKASKRVGDLSIQYSDLSKNYRQMASDYQAQADRGATPYLAGMSKSDMESYRCSTDRVGAFTTLDQFDNKGGSFGGYMPPNSGGG